MTIILAIALFAQTLTGIQAYTVADPDSGQIELQMDNGLYGIDLGLGCDSLVAGVNVEWLAGSGDVGALVSSDSDHTCNVYINSKISDTPCAMNSDGVCDITSAE